MSQAQWGYFLFPAHWMGALRYISLMMPIAKEMTIVPG